MVQVPHWAPQPRSPDLRTWNPKTCAIESQQGMHREVPEDCREIETLLLKGGHRFSQAPSSCTKAVIWKDPIRHICWSWRGFQRGKSQLGFALGTLMLVRAFEGVFLPQGCWCWQAPFWSPSSSLLVPKAYASTSESLSVLRPPGSRCQLCRDPSLPTSKQAATT